MSLAHISNRLVMHGHLSREPSVIGAGTAPTRTATGADSCRRKRCSAEPAERERQREGEREREGESEIKRERKKEIERERARE